MNNNEDTSTDNVIIDNFKYLFIQKFGNNYVGILPIDESY